MKIAIFFSYQSRGFFNHSLRLNGFCAENPSADCVWFNLDHLPSCSDYSFGKFDKLFLLADKEKLSQSETRYLASHRLPYETIPIEYALKANPRALSFCEERWVFCASQEADKAWNEKFWEQSNQSCPTLFLCQEQGVLEHGALPGPLTFFAPISPQFHQDAISNAACVVSTSWEPCLVARTAGRVAIKLSSQVEQTNPWGVPEVAIRGRSAREVFEECSRIYEIHRNAKPVPRKLSKYPTESELFHLTSISDFSYLPFYLGMIENVLRQSKQNIKLHLLALDNQVGPFLEKRYPG
ncbi:MAG: hypothetical protein ACKN9V_00090, partial [Pseudomonadota bacterium]